MLQNITERDRAKLYHRLLPDRIRRYLNRRGIPDEIINRHLLGWDGRRITIPVFGRDGDVLFQRLAKGPNDHSDSPKVLSPAGVGVELYGWDTLARQPSRVVICEGEFDRLVLEAHGFPAVTSTGGAGVFPKKWAPFFAQIPEIYICFDHDAAGEAGAANVKRILPPAHIIRLPSELGEKGDVTDYFVRMKKSRSAFEKLLRASKQEDSKPRSPESRPPSDHRSVSARAKRLIHTIPIQSIVEQYVDLRRSGEKLTGLCPFHADKRPSLTVYPATSTYFCFGCGAHGDVISFLMNKESITFGQALEALERFLYTNELFRKSS